MNQRLDTYLETHDYEALWLAEPASVAWLVGASTVVNMADSPGVAAAGYDGDSVTVITNNIEAPRLAEEELPADTQIIDTQWYRESLAAAVAEHSPTPAAADFAVPGLEEVSVSGLRQPLTDEQIAEYRELGADTASALEAVCEELHPELTEQTVQGMLRGRLNAKGIRAPVALVGSSSRAPNYRHYTATDAPLENYALLSVTACRSGQHASVTRTVAFDPPSWLADRTEAAARVEATALAATQTAGDQQGTASDVFGAIQDAYRTVGHEGEWRNHHQGGAAGYASREWVATPSSNVTVRTPMAYAWNPTVPGAKSENTWLVTEDGFDCLTRGDYTSEPLRAVESDVELAYAPPIQA